MVLYNIYSCNHKVLFTLFCLITPNCFWAWDFSRCSLLFCFVLQEQKPSFGATLSNSLFCLNTIWNHHATLFDRILHSCRRRLWKMFSYWLSLKSFLIYLILACIQRIHFHFFTGIWTVLIGKFWCLCERFS